MDESMQAREIGHGGIWKDVQTNSFILEGVRVFVKNARGLNIEGQIRRVTRKERKRLREEF